MKYKSSIIIFLLCFSTHFIYDIYPCFISSILGPTNESFFQHTKMVATASLIYMLIFKNTNNKIYIKTCIRVFLINIILFLLYLPFIYLKYHNFIFTIFILLISIIIVDFIIKKSDKYIIVNKFTNIISIILILIFYIISTYLTYNPPKNIIFYDNKYNTYLNK